MDILLKNDFSLQINETEKRNKMLNKVRPKIYILKIIN